MYDPARSGSPMSFRGRRITLDAELSFSDVIVSRIEGLLSWIGGYRERRVF
jgi:hypothetical protein